MRKSTIAGLVAAGIAGLAAGGVALAARGEKQNKPFCEYRVKAGDTLSALGLKFFGDAKKWPVLLEGQDKPFSMMEALPVGIALRVPCKWHKVAPGETLAKIAKDELGDGGRWKRIAELNKAKLPDPDRLEIGSLLAVPLADIPAGSSPSANASTVAVGGLDLLGEDEIAVVGKGGGGHGGGGRHGGHGHSGGRGLRGGAWGWGGGPYFWGPWYSDGIEVDELDGPTAEEVAAELAKHLKGHAS